MVVSNPIGGRSNKYERNTLSV